MLTFVIESGFCQFVNYATRGCNLLDIVLANDSLIISYVEAAPPLGNSDHNTISIHSDFVGFGISSMSDHLCSRIYHGRRFGGVGFL